MKWRFFVLRTEKEKSRMAGYHIVCKRRSNGSKCSTSLFAESKDELLEAALDHSLEAHGLKMTTGLKQELKASMRKGRPAAS